MCSSDLTTRSTTASSRPSTTISSTTARSSPSTTAGSSAPDSSAPDSSRTADVLRRTLLQMVQDIPPVITDPVEPRYRPSTRLTDLVRLRDQHCAGPGCSHPGDQCDLDHRDPWPLGPTAASNLTPLSRRCHNAKTFTWQLHRTPTGSHTWTSPTGRTYTTPPPWQRPPDPSRPRPRTTCHPQADPGPAAPRRDDLVDPDDSAGPTTLTSDLDPAALRPVPTRPDTSHADRPTVTPRDDPPPF